MIWINFDVINIVKGYLLDFQGKQVKKQEGSFSLVETETINGNNYAVWTNPNDNKLPNNFNVKRYLLLNRDIEAFPKKHYLRHGWKIKMRDGYHKRCYWYIIEEWDN